MDKHTPFYKADFSGHAPQATASNHIYQRRLSRAEIRYQGKLQPRILSWSGIKTRVKFADARHGLQYVVVLLTKSITQQQRILTRVNAASALTHRVNA